MELSREEASLLWRLGASVEYSWGDWPKNCWVDVDHSGQAERWFEYLWNPERSSFYTKKELQQMHFRLKP